LLEIARHLMNAEQLEDSTLKAGALYVAARSAWDLGYQAAARRYLARALAADADAFEPLIWSVYFAIQNDDLQTSSDLLDHLMQIDPDDPIVTDLAQIDRLMRRQQTEHDPERIAGMFLEIAHAYQRLELSSPAIDASIAAIRTDRSNAAAHDLLETLLLSTGRTFAAGRIAQRR